MDKEAARQWFLAILEPHLTEALLERLSDKTSKEILEFEVNRALKNGAKHVKAA